MNFIKYLFLSINILIYFLLSLTDAELYEYAYQYQTILAFLE